ncbi:hypothetical protein EDD21DRAFT_360165 [Dissophora ornata]|nr:hypothetical protein EDD21DRAFT_360165 [Dissophora ornata]
MNLRLALTLVLASDATRFAIALPIRPGTRDSICHGLYFARKLTLSLFAQHAVLGSADDIPDENNHNVLWLLLAAFWIYTMPRPLKIAANEDRSGHTCFWVVLVAYVPVQFMLFFVGGRALDIAEIVNLIWVATCAVSFCLLWGSWLVRWWRERLARRAEKRAQLREN